MFKTFNKFSTKLFLSISIFLITIVVVIFVILMFSNITLKINIEKSSEKVESDIYDLANKTWYDNYMVTMGTIADESVNTFEYVFDSIKLDIEYLAQVATSSYRQKNDIDFVLQPPDKTKDGELTAQLTFEPDVDVESKEIQEELKILADVANEMILDLEYSVQVTRSYIVTESGIMVMVDRTPSDRYDEEGNLITVTHRNKSWYKKAIEANGVIVNDVVRDILTGDNALMFLKAYEVDGIKKGVIAFDVYTNLLSEIDIGLSTQDKFDVIIFDQNASVVFTSDSENGNAIEEGDNIEDFVRRNINMIEGFGHVTYKGKENLVRFKKVEESNLLLLVLIEEAKVNEDVVNLSQMVAKKNSELIDVVDALVKNLTATVFLVVIITLFVSFTFAKIVSNLFSKPLDNLTKEINEMSADNIKKVKTDYSSIEFVELANIFNGMMEKIRKYVSNIEKISEEKEKIKAELNVAKKIQQNMLPKTFDSFSQRKDIDISAINLPETEVGGDFYNYILLNNKLLLIIADVSGSGIPAALFMAKTNSLINSAIKLSDSPRVILSYVNSELYKSNDENYFVTIGIYCIDLNTKKIFSANAGHVNPIFIKSDTEVDMVIEKKTVPIGITPNLIIEENEYELQEGDMLFLYTDGVVEAINDKDELYGNKRLIDELKNVHDLSSSQIIDKVVSSVQSFSNIPEQYDDITMLCFKFVDNKHTHDETKVYRYNREYEANYEAVDRINEFVREALKEAYGDDDSRYKGILSRFDVCTEELVVNIVDYAYKDIHVIDLKKVYVDINIDKNNDKVSITYIDNGPEFNPLMRDDPNILRSAEERKIGGLGIYITKQYVDNIEYEYINNQNRLTIVKYL